MKIYTRRGDAGETDLFGGERVAKDHARVVAYGAVDELNAALGVAVASAEAELGEIAQGLQSSLFDLGAYLASPDDRKRSKAGVREPDEADVTRLEAHIDALEQGLEPLRRFVLPGGAPGAAAFHTARTVCRRAERAVVTLNREQPLNPWALRYLNRLSDLLFVMARAENHRAGIPDVEWSGSDG